jgi:hypothetical protein
MNSNWLSDFGGLVSFCNYIVTNFSDFNFCDQRWKNETYLNEEDGTFYNYFTDKVNKIGPVSFLYVTRSGYPVGEINKVLAEWKGLTNTKFSMDPLGIFPLHLLYAIENYLGEDEIRTVLKGRKEATVNGAVDIYMRKPRDINRVYKLWNFLSIGQKKLLLRWARKESRVIKKESEENKELYNLMLKKYTGLFK